ncbi:MAG: glycosyltransferase [Planctomycetes bacterium]|nr:glycosyltransferase [Planctomycetota bacterium]
MNRTGSLKIVHTITSIASSTGGPARSVVGLCEALARQGHRPAICTQDTTESLGPDFPADPSVAVIRSRCMFVRPLRLAVPVGYGRALDSACGRADVLHSHGLWEPINYLAARTAARLKIPHVISPRGSLQQAALRRSGWKKAVAGAVFARRTLASADCIHAASMLEARHAAMYQPHARAIAVVPNGLDLAEYQDCDEDRGRQILEVRWPEMKGRRIVLFLGRLHPHKGTVELIEAWAELTRTAAGHDRDWLLVLAGPDQDGHAAQLRRRLADLGAADSVVFTGQVAGQEKLALLAACRFLVLPSASENFGLAAAEALASARPVVVNESSPWQELEQTGCGLVAVGRPGGSLRECVSRMMSMPDAGLAEMGRSGRKFVQDRFAWQTVAEQMIALYDWLARDGPRPAFVYRPPELV